MKIISTCQSKMQHALFKASMESVCLKFLIYFYASVSMTCLYLQKSQMIWYLLELALSSKHLTMEIKDFLFTPVPTMPPHHHLWPNPVTSLVRNQSWQSGIKHFYK